MKFKFYIRRCISKKGANFTYLALVAKTDNKTCFVSFDTAIIYQLCDASILDLLKPGEEVAIDV